MKKLITFSTVCIIICIGFSSCMSNLAITKRHYNKGYYIDYASTKQIAFLTKEKVSDAKIVAPVYAIPGLAVKNTQNDNSTLMPKTENKISTSNTKKIQHKAALPSNTMKMVKNLPAAVEAPILQASSSVTGLNNVTDGDHSSRDALSLFWLIILIILIVWVIGLIAGGWGLGGFINILLLVALILLILWLLRII